MTPTPVEPVALQLGFIIGGVQKSATTTLFGHLREHPDLRVPVVKELHFFDDESLDWSRPDYGRLSAQFPPGEGIPFEITPIYLFWPPALERIQRYRPDIKLIFIFRDPIERAWSHWRMEFSRGAETLPFDVAIRQGRWRLRGISPLDPAWRVFSYVERGFYGSQVRHLLSLFPRDNILFLRTADLQRDHTRVLTAITDFVGARPVAPSAPRRDHEGLLADQVMEAGDIAYLQGLFTEDVLAFSSLNGLPVDDWLTLAGGSEASPS